MIVDVTVWQITMFLIGFIWCMYYTGALLGFVVVGFLKKISKKRI